MFKDFVNIFIMSIIFHSAKTLTFIICSTGREIYVIHRDIRVGFYDGTIPSY